MKAIGSKFTLGLLFTLLTSSHLWAFEEFHSTGDILKPHQYHVGLYSQWAKNPSDALNLSMSLDSGLDDGSNVRVVMGSGDVSFHTGVYYKWVPIPDYQDQPAIGILGGGQYARYDGFSELSLRFYPFVSKKQTTSFGDFNHSASLPISMRNYKDETDFPVQLTLGTQLKTHYFKYTLFSAEIGANITKSFSYISVGVIFYIDENNSLKFD